MFLFVTLTHVMLQLLIHSISITTSPVASISVLYHSPIKFSTLFDISPITLISSPILDSRVSSFPVENYFDILPFGHQLFCPNSTQS